MKSEIEEVQGEEKKKSLGLGEGRGLRKRGGGRVERVEFSASALGKGELAPSFPFDSNNDLVTFSSFLNPYSSRLRTSRLKSTSEMQFGDTRESSLSSPSSREVNKRDRAELPSLRLALLHPSFGRRIHGSHPLKLTYPQHSFHQAARVQTSSMGDFASSANDSGRARGGGRGRDQLCC